MKARSASLTPSQCIQFIKEASGSQHQPPRCALQRIRSLRSLAPGLLKCRQRLESLRCGCCTTPVAVKMLVMPTWQRHGVL